ncbi:hypothetical protein KG091_07870 [Carnobacteriaceae bacterium zg-ZUI78]|nr:hypothetical protein [Carnobacteriaceae bacterium zg-ZUI78]
MDLNYLREFVEETEDVNGNTGIYMKKYDEDGYYIDYLSLDCIEFDKHRNRIIVSFQE